MIQTNNFIDTNRLIVSDPSKQIAMEIYFGVNLFGVWNNGNTLDFIRVYLKDKLPPW